MKVVCAEGAGPMRAGATNSQGLHVIDGVVHYELYDESECVDQAARHRNTFFTQHLVGREPYARKTAG